jgi:high affinity sulfate transporter 1
MAGAAITIALQQLKGLLGISTASFTKNTDIISVLTSVFKHTDEVLLYIVYSFIGSLQLAAHNPFSCPQSHQWSWRTIVIGISFLAFLLLTKYIVSQLLGLELYRRPNYYAYY